ncbi:MAG TPA: hypothetical protein VJ898_02645 [Natrialbaceae archaeon]|nr:hypothetical protein [Natrialbaceae archaeon]
MDTSFTDTITTDDAFEATLEDLLAAAETNDVRIEGGWECNGHDDTSWDVVITRVVPEADD